MSNPSPHHDDLIVRRIQGMVGENHPVTPTDVRLMGVFMLVAAAVLAGINLYSLRDGSVYVKSLVITPSAALLGLWLLVDADALAACRRRNQSAILWTCILVGAAVGAGVLYALTGGFW